MGRRRTKNKHLPRHMQFKHGSYYHVAAVDGRPRWLKLASDYGDALRKWAELEGEAPKQTWTVAGAIAHFLQVSKANGTLKPATLRGYAEGAKQLIPVFGPMAIADLRRDQIYSYVVARGNVAGNRERALLSAVYTHMLNAGILKGENPAHGLRYRNKETPRKRYITDAEFATLISSASKRWKPLLLLGYLTGMRQADVRGLMITNATAVGIEYIESKTGNPRLIDWTDELRATWKAAAGLRIGKVPLFPARGGEAYTESGFKASWRKVKLRAGLGDITFHDVRRKAGSDTTLEHAQALLGHKDAKITSKHYRAKIVGVKPIERV